MHALVSSSMDCRSSYPGDYRHHHNAGALGENNSGVGGAYNNSYPYTNHLNAMRYQPQDTSAVTNASAAAMYRNGVGRAPPGMYDSYDRYMYHPSTSPMSYTGYSPIDGAAVALGTTSGYGYGNPNNNRTSAYYGYDGYRIPPLHPYQNHMATQQPQHHQHHNHHPHLAHHHHHHHHQQQQQLQQQQHHYRHPRDPHYSNTEMMYAARNGYLMRDPPISIYHQGGGGREFGSSGGAGSTSGGYFDFAYHHQTSHHNFHNNSNSREFYQSHTPHPLAIPSPVMDPNSPLAVASTAASAASTAPAAVAVVPSTTSSAVTGSTYAEYPTVPTTPSPCSSGIVAGPNCCSPSSNFNSTGHSMANKECKTRKIPRDKSLAKIAAMSRRLESGSTTPLMFNDIDHDGSPTPGGHHHQLSAYHHHHDGGGFSAGSNGFSPHSSSFHDDYMLPSPMHNSQSPNCELAAASSGSPTVTSTVMLPVNVNWTNNNQHSSRAYRKRKSATSDACMALPLSSIGRLAASQPLRECHKKFFSGVHESDFIPSKKKKRTNQKENDDTFGSREELLNITPLPGFQQAFGSTEIGRFSEIFFNASESPTEPYGMESEADTLSPQPWEMGDSLEGPLINHQFGGGQPLYVDGYASTDSPASSSYFSEIRCNDF